ncbi:hypothetical protein HUU05_00810 [candidate division KSB1 bacterium]|nr:hypothetical protein [candidate division KSB1 bacterium]
MDRTDAIYDILNKEVFMEYKVIPFRADIMITDTTGAAAQQLAELINQHATEGWNYHGLESLSTRVTTPATPGSSGCLGIGATPGSPAFTETAEIYVAIFYK